MEPKFHVIPDVKHPRINREWSDAKLSYEENLRISGQSEIIVDVCMGGQSGLTLRVLEAMFLGKRLISNNSDLRHIDFFDEKNIFLIDQPYSVDDLKRFCFSKEPANWGGDILRYSPSAAMRYVLEVVAI